MIDWRIARICSVLANCHRDPKKRAFTEKDFMPREVEEKKEVKGKPKQSPEEMLTMVRIWNARIGGKEIINAN